MHFDDGGIQTQRLDTPLTQSVLLQMCKYLSQDTAVCPTIQAHIDRVPRAETSWQGTLFAAIAGHVRQRIEQPIVADATTASRLGQQMTNAFELSARDMHAGARLSAPA